MIPYFEQPSLRLGPITIHAFGVIVAAAVWIGLSIGARRARTLGIDQRVMDGLAGYVLVCGFLGAHLFAVLLYFPHKVVSDPLSLLRVWEDLSSFGGIIGGFIGVWLYLRFKARALDSEARWAHLDVAAYVFPFSLAIGRLGCTLAHDHPGRVTSFPLAVSLESDAARGFMASVYAGAGRVTELPPAATLQSLGFHDLGWYEFLYLTLVVVPVTYALGRKAPASGTFLMTFMALYLPVRFALDFLRVGDARYAGLTPAQWVALAMIAALPLLWSRVRIRRAALQALAVVALPVAVAAACATPLHAQTATRPLAPIDSSRVAVVAVADFASIPDMNGQAARMMNLVDEPGTKRLFVNDMRGPIYRVSYDGRTVTQYVDVNDSTWGVHVQSQGRERGVQSFAFHPQFVQQGAAGYGKFYTWADSRNNRAAPDFVPGGGSNTHHTVLHEWTAKDASSATYDGGVPRELMRFEQPFGNHNGGMAAFNPLARPGSADYGLLYVGNGDGGSGGDPLNTAQNLANGFGKILRIDPLGRNSRNGSYGIPSSNPFADGRTPNALPEVFAYGLRNPQRFAWDPKNGNMFVSDIGQNIIEEVSLVRAGANLGWNTWEGSFRYAGRQGVDPTNPRADENVIFPLVEYMHGDPVMANRAAVSGLHVFRGGDVPPLRDKVVFSDLVSGELLYFDADRLPAGGSQGIGRVLLKQGEGVPSRFIDLVRRRNEAQGKPAASRPDVRLTAASDGRVFLINKADGTIRVLTR